MRTLGLILLMMLVQHNFAQVINIEDKRIKTDTVGWSGSGELSLYANKNNDMVLSLQTDLHLQYKT